MKIIFLVSGYFTSFRFRHYSLSAKDGENAETVSLRCHRQNYYWQILTKRYVPAVGTQILIWQWISFDDYCLPKDMKKNCAQEGLVLTTAKWNTLQPHDPAEKEIPSSETEELSTT